ncbi:uncharacterized protein LOC113521637 [Galleria mellonella]|uniref:Uncharacterized protein LOC113521637 n=1 Tax=Galleria mellonella TaxID=7137 RepID=A0A6J1X7Z6_GALME|nr:uncharacterized protein LOC113521637 [Galleria mellonella]
MRKFKFLLFLLSFSVYYISSEKQTGPDPWDDDTYTIPVVNDNVPPDLRYEPRKNIRKENVLGISDIFFRRMLAIMLKSGQSKENEDGSIDIVLQMKFDAERWAILENLLKSDSAITETSLRRSMGYIEEAVYKSTILDKIKMAWSDYIQYYLVEYRTCITWTLGLLGVSITFLWLWNHMSHRHVLILIFVALYLYEVFVSYKEAEQQEVKQFLSALQSCKWQFWKSDCEIPPPDIVLFMKYMNPLKIALRMFTSIISEPMIALSDTVKTMVTGITDGLWFPFDKIVYGILILSFNSLLVVLLIMILFNYILNIPFNLSFCGLMSIGVTQRNRTLLTQRNNESRAEQIESADRISGATLDRFLDVVSRALGSTGAAIGQQSNVNSENIPRISSTTVGKSKLHRSASTGRLPSASYETTNRICLESTKQYNKNTGKFKIGPKDGSGDAYCN